MISIWTWQIFLQTCKNFLQRHPDELWRGLPPKAGARMYRLQHRMITHFCLCRGALVMPGALEISDDWLFGLGSGLPADCILAAADSQQVRCPLISL